MREKRANSAISSRSRRGSKSLELKDFGVRPTKRAGQFVGKRYRIEGLLGSGATASVYLAVDTRIGRCVVVKQLNRGGVDDVELRSRFLAEAQALASLRHPGIVRVLDYGVPNEERPYLVLEALVGETLSCLLERRRLLPTDVALVIARHTALGLEAAHRAGIVHRDIKPDNLFLLGPLGDPFGVKILDFGMAKLPQSNGTSGVHTVLGTVEYMAPEQVMADPVDGRTDIYALGIVLFRLVTGHLPFEAKEGLDLLSHQLFSPVPPASWIHEGLEPPIDALVMRATRKHPANRYPDLRSLIADLDAVLGLCPDTPVRAELVVDPDVYEARNEKGREVAELLAERHKSMAPSSTFGQNEREAALELVRFESQFPTANPSEYSELHEDDLEHWEG